MYKAIHIRTMVEEHGDGIRLLGLGRIIQCQSFRERIRARIKQISHGLQITTLRGNAESARHPPYPAHAPRRAIDRRQSADLASGCPEAQEQLQRGRGSILKHIAALRLSKRRSARTRATRPPPDSTAHPSRKALTMLALRGARLAAAAAPRGGALQRAAAAPRCCLSTTTGKAWEPPKAKVAPSSKRLDAISASIFGTLPSTNVRSGNKVLRKKLKGPLLADYYFDQSGVDIDVVGREILSGWMNDREARRKNQLEILRRRGKGPPKKGMGKRSGKK